MNIVEDFDYLNRYNVSDSIQSKYTPLVFDDLCIDTNNIHHIKNTIRNKPFYLLLYGDHDTGKTTLITIILKHYYKDEYNKDNIFYINGLKDYNINVIKQALETFCKSAFVSKYNRTIVVDDIERLHEQNQFIIKSYMDKYKERINILLSCTNKQKIVKSLLNKLSVIYLSKYNYVMICSFMKRIKRDLKFEFGKNDQDEDKIIKYMISMSRMSIRHLFSLFEKLYYIGDTHYEMEDIVQICSSIDDILLETYTNHWSSGNIHLANDVFDSLVDKGYNVIDILEAYFSFIKRTIILDHTMRLKVVSIISKYISIYHLCHENNMELYLFTYELIKMKQT